MHYFNNEIVTPLVGNDELLALTGTKKNTFYQ